MSGQSESDNLVIRDDESEFEDFDGDDTMEKLFDLFLFHRKDAKAIDWFQLISFIIFFFVNVGCVSYNLYKSLTQGSNTTNVADDLTYDNTTGKLYERNFISNITSIFNTTTNEQTKPIFDNNTKVLYIAEFSVISLFLIIALYNFILLIFNPSSKTYLSNAANFTRLVREFSCFSLVPLFNVNTIMGIYTDIANTFENERKKYADRSKLWDGIWGMGTKDVQKSNSALDLAVETTSHDQLNESDNNQVESRFKRFKHSKMFLHLISVAIYTGFFASLLIMIALAAFAFIALFVKTRHVGNFIIYIKDDNIYKWFNFITFIMNIASLTQQSPAIKLIIFQLKVLTKKAHYNKYRRRKQNRIKENNTVFDADKEEEGIQPPKIIIHRKRLSRTQRDSEVEKILINSELDSLEVEGLASTTLKRKSSKLSAKSNNSV